MLAFADSVAVMFGAERVQHEVRKKDLKEDNKQ